VCQVHFGLRDSSIFYFSIYIENIERQPIFQKPLKTLQLMSKLVDMGRLEDFKDEFIAEWGALGPAWGMTRTVSRIHALLMVSEHPLTTDEIMEALSISRGGAHGALKELAAMGISKSAIRKGERKETFVGEKDPWRVFCAIMRERKRREVEPVLAMLNRCLVASKDLEGDDARFFTDQLRQLREFVDAGDRVMEKIGNSERATILKWMMGLLSTKGRRS
jgi:DNA-binding transcriptional regulator GbsR (MarR family)